jgi:hypothetical protein
VLTEGEYIESLTRSLLTDNFLGLGTEEFKKARERIFARATNTPEALRLQLDAIIYPVMNGADLEALRKN